MKTRIFLVDDEPAVLKGLELLLSREPFIEICGQAGCAAEALKQILPLDPDLAIIDLSLGEGSGLDLIRDLRSFGSKPRILVFSMHSDPSFIRAAFRAGADGYVVKEEGTEKLIEAISAVVKGKCFLTETIAAKFGFSSTDLRVDSARIPGHD
jgi:DNA-binding NarL/FixJ family response regulator